VLRGVFAVVFAVAGFLLGREAYLSIFSLHVAGEAVQLAFLILSPIAGAIIGLFLAPLAQSIFEDELVVVENAIEDLAPSEIAGGAVGLIVGLIIAFLIKNIAFELFTVAGRAAAYIAIVLYIIIAIFAAYLGARVGAKMRFGPLDSTVPAGRAGNVSKVIDTSVIVDGRVAEIVESGFLEGPFVVPRFVLRELQAISDSTDGLKRARGRRGLEVLARLQELATLDISERDYADLPPGSVDAKLIRVAQELGGKLLTSDYNLNRVAHLEGVTSLNINDLANAVKPLVIPGEELRVQVIRDGKEPHQGVGYLDDGTMIVVEQGNRLIGDSVDVLVTSILQTSAGRMIFAKPKRDVPT